MIHLLKKGLLLFIALCLSIFLLAIYMSLGNLPKESYAEVIDYSESFDFSDSTLKVMTYNLGYLSGMTNNRSIQREEEFFNEHLQKAKNLMREADASIIGFQEIDFGASRSFHINQLDSLAIYGDYVSGYKSINWDKKYVPFPYWPPSNHFGEMLSGQAIISRLPLENAERIILNPNLNAPAYYRAFYLDRLLQIAEVSFLGTQVKIMSVHLEAFDKETRLKQIELVKSEFDKYASKQPVILMGDFNSKIPRESDGIDAIEVLMKSKWISSAIPFENESISRTFPSAEPVKMIDYIFYNENFITPIQAKILIEAGQISDHLPVLAEFKLR
ncbi:MAG: endonuclease/exonuclease/phosphatase family protein [Ekhidna sp.]